MTIKSHIKNIIKLTFILSLALPITNSLADDNLPTQEDKEIEDVTSQNDEINETSEANKTKPEIVSEEVNIGYNTIINENTDLEKGSKKIIQEGKLGIKKIYKEVVDGEVIKILDQEDILSEPVDEIVEVGTKETINEDDPDIIEDNNDISESDASTNKYEKIDDEPTIDPVIEEANTGENVEIIKNTDAKNTSSTKKTTRQTSFSKNKQTNKKGKTNKSSQKKKSPSTGITPDIIPLALLAISSLAIKKLNNYLKA